MKIEREIENVRIVRYSTIAETLLPVFKKSHADIVSGLMGGDFRVNNFSQQEQEVLSKPLARYYEGDRVYRRTCALVSLDRDWTHAEFFHELADTVYYPAGISEGISYATLLIERGVRIDAIFHLGARILDEKYQELRLLTREDGRCEFIPFYSATKLRPYYHIVVVKKENTPKER